MAASAPSGEKLADLSEDCDVEGPAANASAASAANAAAASPSMVDVGVGGSGVGLLGQASSSSAKRRRKDKKSGNGKNVFVGVRAIVDTFHICSSCQCIILVYLRQVSFRLRHSIPFFPPHDVVFLAFSVFLADA